MSELRWILLGCGAILLLGIFLWGRRSRGQAAVDEFEAEGRLDPGLETVSVPVLSHPEMTAGPDRPVGNRWHEDEWTSTVTDLPEIRLDDPHSLDDLLEPRLDDEFLEPVADPFAAPVQDTDSVTTPKAASSVAGTAPESVRSRQPEKRKIVALRLIAPLTDRYVGHRLRAVFEAAGLAHGKYGIFHRLRNDRSIFSVASMVEPGSFDLATMGETQFAGVTLFALLPGPVAASEAYDQLIDCARHLERTLGGELHDERGQLLTPQRLASLRDEVLDFEHLLGSSAHA